MPSDMTSVIYRFQQIIFFKFGIIYCDMLILVMQSYTELRKAREYFREKLVRLIVQDKTSGSGADIPSAHERKILRYHYYIKHGIETVHVAPLDKNIIVR